jgi:hypothetical protein
MTKPKTFIFCLTALLLTSNLSFAQTKGADLNNILSQVSEVINELEYSSSLPSPGEVSVTFQIEKSTETNIGLNVLIFKFGRKWNRAHSNEMTFEYTVAPKETVDKIDIKNQLSLTIIEALNQVKNVSNSDLTLKEFSVKISFTIEKSTSVSGEYELSPITPSASRSTRKKAVHTIEIVFN